METTPRHPMVTSGPILGNTFLTKNDTNPGHVQEPENQCVFPVVLRKTAVKGSSQYQNKHALLVAAASGGFLF